MLAATWKKGLNGRITVRMKGRIEASSAIDLRTFLEEAIDNGITHLTLDCSEVLAFDYTGIALSVAILEFYARDFSEIIYCGLPQNINNVFKGFRADKIPGLKIVPTDDPKGLAVSNL